MFRHERNARIHAAAVVVVIAAGVTFRIAAWEWCVLILTMALVLAAEALNTAIETLLDAVHPAEHPEVGRAKDLAAGGVLVTAIGAVAVGAILFGPRLIRLFMG